MLLAIKGDKSMHMNNGTTELMYASARGQTKKVSNFLSEQENVNARNNYGESALMWAALYGHQEIVKMLLASGADPTAKDLENTSVLMYAEMAAHGNNKVKEDIIGIINKKIKFKPVNTSMNLKNSPGPRLI